MEITEVGAAAETRQIAWRTGIIQVYMILRSYFQNLVQVYQTDMGERSMNMTTGVPQDFILGFTDDRGGGNAADRVRSSEGHQRGSKNHAKK